MKLFKRLREIGAGHKEALEGTQELQRKAEQQGEVADALLAKAEEQAKSLTDHNIRNHYSQGLQRSFRGKYS